MDTQLTIERTPTVEIPVKGGVATWACLPGFPPAVIFPFTPPQRYGMRSTYEFQMLMYRPLYWIGRDGGLDIDFDLSIGEPPVWAADGRTCTVRVKPWRWSNGETVCADNVIFWMNMLVRHGPEFGAYVEGLFPDNLVSFAKVSDDTVSFTFDKVYSQNWVLINQLTMITPMPKAWDRTAAGPADASHDIEQVDEVFEYLCAGNGDWVAETNEHRVRWPDSPIWSVVNGPWRLKTYTHEGAVTFVPNEHYSGPNKPHLDEFRQIPIETDEQEYELLKAGPVGPDAVQVGYLPMMFGSNPTGDPTVGGPNPLGDAYKLVPQILFNVHFMAINFTNASIAGKLLRQPYIRQALQSCLDQDHAVRDIYQGYAWREDGPVPTLPPSELISPKLREGGLFWPFDPVRARTLLSENGWDTDVFPAVCVRPGTGPGEAGEGIPTGTRLSLSMRYVEGRPALTRLMEKFHDDATSAGIELRLQEVFGSQLVAEDGPGEPTPEHPRTWELSCWDGGWVYNYPTGENLFASGASCNFSNYKDARADQLIATTCTSDDLADLWAYQEYIAEQVPVIFTPNFPRRLHAFASNLRGVTPINPYGLINPEDWYYVEETS